ncbi:hypothetical protein DW1_2062 [Proteiniborus sp. DW1]|uniref:hypothetical protein n=1 Tax=Proteiniborus sp. DW1 TaxID=1889883 RepID=UPI00092DF9E4|nr:hypothetical protein [Proteiniborus sp. DW1]SCG83629.1 hypothetical protein DW1_2062 [Proteiniborus sp. DW1]
MIILESRVERYQKSKIHKRQRRIKTVILILSIIIFVFGLDTVDKAVRDMMNIQDKQLYFFSYNDNFYKVHLLGTDYLVDKKEIDDKIDYVKKIMEDFVKLADNYLDKIWIKIKTR